MRNHALKLITLMKSLQMLEILAQVSMDSRFVKGRTPFVVLGPSVELNSTVVLNEYCCIINNTSIQSRYHYRM